MKKLIDLQGLTTFLGEIRRIFATKTELTGYQPKGEYVTTESANTTYAKKAELTGYQPKGEYVTAENANTTYAKKAELTGYQPKGEYVTVSSANETFAKKADMTKAMNYRGSVDTFSALPKTGVQIGDMYNVSAADSGRGIKAGDNVVYNGNDWDVMGGVIDLSDYATKVEMQQAVGDITTASDSDVQALFS